MALGEGPVAEVSFDLEKMIFAKNLSDSTNEKHIFVSGLARAGTTILMQSLYQTQEFASLTYRDMPFVLAPNLWDKITQFSRREKIAQNRAHGDGQEIHFDAPEALDEIFWKTFCQDQYIKKNSLIPMQADAKTLDEFRTYISLILLRYGKRRYLSKNNNSVLRLPSLCKAFPHGQILVPFRNPFQQAASLFEQHQRFLQIHKEDPFTFKYMTWLAHHEFGSHHRPFVFRPDSTFSFTPDQLDYWLELWIHSYRFLLDQFQNGVPLMFINFENLCQNPDETLRNLFERLDLTYSPKIAENIRPPKSKEDLPFQDESLTLKAQDLFQELCSSSL